jgi:hypothetical protein
LLGDGDGALGHGEMQPLDHTTVDHDNAPFFAFSGSANALMILRDQSISSAVGEKISLQGRTWLGWIRVFPSMPSVRLCSHSWRKPISS